MITAEQSEQLRAWFAERLPLDVYESLVSVTADREEITVIGTVPATESVKEFRERTREQRIEVAREAESLYRRKVAWGVRAGEETTLFTHLAVPVMTRLRQSERQVLDTLVAGGVARSRADALAWCVRLVGRNTDTWLGELRDSLDKVHQVREQGPDRAGATDATDSRKSGSE
uniref:Smu12A n=1 Tax=Streptomyces sp. NBC_00049 TaxID=2903617 RepID=A0AAU2JJE1_9ACTN